jgi:hypothetical protein
MLIIVITVTKKNTLKHTEIGMGKKSWWYDRKSDLDTKQISIRGFEDKKHIKHTCTKKKQIAKWQKSFSPSTNFDVNELNLPIKGQTFWTAVMSTCFVSSEIKIKAHQKKRKKTDFQNRF